MITAGVGGLGLVDIALRLVPEALGVGDGIVLPAALKLITEETITSSELGIATGLVMLVVPVLYLTPRLFPREFFTSRHNIVLRTVVGVSVLAVTLYTREAILVLVVGESTWVPVTPSVRSAVQLLVGIIVGLIGILYLPWERVGSAPRVSGPSTGAASGGWSDVGDGGAWPSVADLDAPMGPLATATLLVVGVGVVLATVSLLYPIPELLAVGVGLVVPVAGVTTRTVGLEVPWIQSGDQLTDIAEPLVLAVRSVWDGVGGAAVFVYTVVILYSLSLAGAQDVVSQFQQHGPFVWVLYGGTVLVPVIYAVRYVERAYRHLLTGGVVHVPYGIMLPAGILSGLAAGVSRAGFERPSEVVSAWTTPMLWLTVGGGVVALALAFLPRWRRRTAKATGGPEVGLSAPERSIPVGLAGLAGSQDITASLVTYHLTSRTTVAGTMQALGEAAVTGGLVAVVIVVVPWVGVYLFVRIVRTLVRAVPVLGR
ncbi:hypothetical protein RYH80_19555 [Halobaculum sp. MBLA0147]|uniref:hypothetical protein n=1 Tax=Halobaculum sp. MBLA0147 TaxID=3079934 RepID=UPI00352497C6